MKTFISTYDFILTKVKFFCKQLKLKIRQSTGRPLKIDPEEIIALALWKQTNGIPTKKAIWKIFKENLKRSYKTLVVNLNKMILPTLLVFQAIMNLSLTRVIFPKI